MSGTTGRINWRIRLSAVLVYALAVVLAFALVGRGAGLYTAVAGILGYLGVKLGSHLAKRRTGN